MGLSYGHIYQLLFYIEIMSDAEPMVISGSLTEYITTTRSAVNDTVAEMRMRTIVSSRSQQRYTYSSIS